MPKLGGSRVEKFKKLLSRHEKMRKEEADCAAIQEQLLKQLNEVAADARAIKTQVVPTLKQNLAQTSGLSKKATKKLNAIENEIDKSLDLINLTDSKTENTLSNPLQPEILANDIPKPPSAPPSYTSETLKTSEIYPALPPPSSSFVPPPSTPPPSGAPPNPFSYVVMKSGQVTKQLNQPSCFIGSTRNRKYGDQAQSCDDTCLDSGMGPTQSQALDALEERQAAYEQRQLSFEERFNASQERTRALRRQAEESYRRARQQYDESQAALRSSQEPTPTQYAQHHSLPEEPPSSPPAVPPLEIIPSFPEFRNLPTPAGIDLTTSEDSTVRQPHVTIAPHMISHHPRRAHNQKTHTSETARLIPDASTPKEVKKDKSVGREPETNFTNTPTLKDLKLQLELIIPYTANKTIMDWVSENLNIIKHGDGTTPHDRLILKALIKELKESDEPVAKEAATGLTNLFQSPGQTWDDAIADLATAFPSGVSQLSAQLIKTIEGFSLDRHRPKIILAPAFKAAKIDLNKLISETINGDQYLSAIRKKLIPSIQTQLYNAENMTWNNFFTTLQQLYNARLKDQAYSFDKPSYHDQPLTNLPLEKATFPVQTTRGGQPSRGQYAPQPMRAPPARSNPPSTTYVPGNNSSPAPRNRSRPPQRQSPANSSDNRPNMNAPEAVSFRSRCSPQLEKDLGLIA